jgi:hypothetical protein
MIIELKHVIVLKHAAALIERERERERVGKDNKLHMRPIYTYTQ